MPLSSIFEVYSAGPGPSSTHSIGPQRAAQRFLALLPSTPARVRVTLYGSLAATGRGHWTDKTLLRALSPVPAEVVFDFDTPADSLPHPNTLRFEAFDASGALLAPSPWTVCSIGGGNLADASLAPLPDPSAPPPVAYPVGNIAAAMDFCRANDLAFWQLVELTEPDVWTRLDAIWTAMCATIQAGLQSSQIVLPGTLELPRRAPIMHYRAQTLKGTKRTLALFASYALAVAEENAAGQTVVTAPSCGAAGVLPAVLYFYQTKHREPRPRILQALATAGLFGASIRANATVSGAEAGCQAEVGSACSMAAAAAAQLEGASLFQIEYAAEMAMEHNLGLTCDPVEGYVQIPCIERNMNAALRAVECATMALLSDGRHLVSFDAVVEVMASTGRDLQAAYRETATGGLARLWRRNLESSLAPHPTP
ncbi:MAG: L-serine ammonia-lyase, iron-sulfur-dependent, subunit alpha [Kiritimatiellae bacterium]|nr:L-serine ammonia-lyase, iron-sulfur-dependent, subunit alpha [Kiritimatiellia bacterium]